MAGRPARSDAPDMPGALAALGRADESDTPGFQEALRALESGMPAVFPTDTVYGLGVSVRHAASPQAIFDLKRRSAGKPVAWLVDGPKALDQFGADVPETARELARDQWPGALTLIVKAGPAVPPAFASAQGTIGLRMPASSVALALMREVGGPLATSSANLSGGPAPRSAAEVPVELLDTVPCIVEDSQVKSGIASTVVDCTQEPPVVLRP